MIRHPGEEPMAEFSLLERALLFYGTRMPDHPRKWWLHDRLLRTCGIAIDREIDVVRNGLRWLLNPSDFEHAGLFWLGSKDPWDLYHLRRLLGPGSVFFDVGANFGYYSVALANALDRRCQVHAFEPNPKTYDRLLRHIEWNGLKDVVLPVPFALSDRRGTATLIERSDNSGASRIGDDAAGITVELTRLDDYCAERGIDRLDALKIDVEGLEARVLAGGRETLARFKPAMIVEFWTTGLERAHSSEDEVAGALDDLGYKLFQPIRDSLVPIAEPPRSTDPKNVFCFHPDRRFPSGGA
jgi:FkbM family methyltransferase